MSTPWLIIFFALLILWLIVIAYIEYRKIKYKQKVIRQIEQEIEIQRQEIGKALVNWVDTQSSVDCDIEIEKD